MEGELTDNPHTEDLRNDAVVEDNQKTVVKSKWGNIKEISAKIDGKVRLKVGISKERTGIVSEISKKGTVRLCNYRKWSEVIRIIKSNDNN